MALSVPHVTLTHSNHGCHRIFPKQVHTAIALKANWTLTNFAVPSIVPAGCGWCSIDFSTSSVCHSFFHTSFQFLTLVPTAPFSCLRLSLPGQWQYLRHQFRRIPWPFPSLICDQHLPYFQSSMPPNLQFLFIYAYHLTQTRDLYCYVNSCLIKTTSMKFPPLHPTKLLS